MKIKMRYDLLFKSGIKEGVIQTALESEHLEVISIIKSSLQEDTPAVITLGDNLGVGRYIRVSDLSQVGTEVLERDVK